MVVENPIQKLNPFERKTREELMKNMPSKYKIVLAFVFLLGFIFGIVALANYFGKPLLNQGGNLVVFVLMIVCIILLIVLLIISFLKDNRFEDEKEKIEDEVDTQDKTKMQHWMLKIENNVLKSPDLKKDVIKLLNDSEKELRGIKGIESSEVRNLTTDSYLNTILQFIKEDKLGDMSAVVKSIQTYKLGVTKFKDKKV